MRCKIEEKEVCLDNFVLTLAFIVAGQQTSAKQSLRFGAWSWNS